MNEYLATPLGDGNTDGSEASASSTACLDATSSTQHGNVFRVLGN